MSSVEQVTVAILAGGHSRRMGTDKSFVLLDGKPLLQHVIDHVSDLNAPLILIANAPEKYSAFDLPIYQDIFPDCGSLGGLYTALYHSRTDFTLCVACDMPFLSVPLLRYLIAMKAGYDLVAPCVAGNIESLHAIYHQSCANVMRQQIEHHQLRIRDLYPRLNALLITETQARRFDPELRSFTNLNTPDQLNQVQELAR